MVIRRRVQPTAIVGAGVMKMRGKDVLGRSGKQAAVGHAAFSL
jgi:hypothetical protein